LARWSPSDSRLKSTDCEQVTLMLPPHLDPD
jgi:hypothetical protein